MISGASSGLLGDRVMAVEYGPPTLNSPRPAISVRRRAMAGSARAARAGESRRQGRHMAAVPRSHRVVMRGREAACLPHRGRDRADTCRARRYGRRALGERPRACLRRAPRNKTCAARMRRGPPGRARPHRHTSKQQTCALTSPSQPVARPRPRGKPTAHGDCTPSRGAARVDDGGQGAVSGTRGNERGRNSRARAGCPVTSPTGASPHPLRARPAHAPPRTLSPCMCTARTRVSGSVRAAARAA